MSSALSSRSTVAATAPIRHASGIQGSAFFSGEALRQRPRSARVSNRTPLSVQNFKFLKDLGLKKPDFLPDFGLEKRKAVLEKFYTSFDAASLNSLLDDDTKIYDGDNVQPTGKKEWVALITEQVKPAIPDFSWSHITSGEKDDEGYSVVKVQAVGSHTGSPYSIPGKGVSPIEPSGRRLKLPEYTVKVKVEEGKIKEIRYLPKQAGTAEEIYSALSGK